MGKPWGEVQADFDSIGYTLPVPPLYRSIHDIKDRISQSVILPQPVALNLPIEVYTFPLGPTIEHIFGMLHGGILQERDIYFGRTRWNQFESRSNPVPQVMGYSISEHAGEIGIDPYVLAKRIIPNPELYQEVVGILKNGGNVPMFTGNYAFLRQWSQYIGLHLPTLEELESIYFALPEHISFDEKLGFLNISLPGYFHSPTKEFPKSAIGDRVHLLASYTDERGYMSCNLSRQFGLKSGSYIDSFQSNPNHGSSTILVRPKNQGRQEW